MTNYHGSDVPLTQGWAAEAEAELRVVAARMRARVEALESALAGMVSHYERHSEGVTSCVVCRLCTGSGDQPPCAYQHAKQLLEIK